MRDYFAAKAMAALIPDQTNPDVEPGNVATWAYRHADAMLAEREKGQS